MKRTVTLVSVALMTMTAMVGCGKKEGANNTREKESVAAAAAQEDVPKKDVAKLQGTWKVVALEGGGRKAPEGSFKEMRFLIEGDRFSLSGKPKGLRPYRLDPAAKPRAIDIPGDVEKEPARRSTRCRAIRSSCVSPNQRRWTDPRTSIPPEPTIFALP